MEVLNKDQILGSHDLKTEEVEVPEWDGKIILREMSGLQRDNLERGDFSKAATEGSMPSLWRVRFLSLCIVDADGKLLFTAEDLQALAEKNATVIDNLCRRAMKLNGFDIDTVEEMKKN